MCGPDLKTSTSRLFLILWDKFIVFIKQLRNIMLSFIHIKAQFSILIVIQQDLKNQLIYITFIYLYCLCYSF